MPSFLIGVRFNRVGKIYNFDASSDRSVIPGDYVIVETSRGLQVGEVVKIIGENETANDENLKPIQRRATSLDLVKRFRLEAQSKEVLRLATQRARELALEGVKIVLAEHTFDASRVIVYYCSDSEEKVDLKSLRQDLQRTFSPVNVELRQIGPRDVAKNYCGIGACGLEKRCCSRFLSEFASISIRMAKDQGVSLTPNEITGMCGRLRCCLGYENEQYVEALSGLPKRNKRVITPLGEGKVTELLPLQGIIYVDIPDVGIREFTSQDIQIVENPPPQAKQKDKDKDKG